MAERRDRRTAWLSHPLVVTFAGAILASILVPLFTRQWQDRQKELDLKRDLVQQIAGSSTTAVRGAISLEKGRLRAAGGDAGEGAQDVYATLDDAWLTQRSTTLSLIATYFPGLGDCWFKYSDAISDFVAIAPINGKPKANRKKVAEIQGYINGTKTCQRIDKLPYKERSTYTSGKNTINWEALKSGKHGFEAAYEKLGPVLLIGRDGIVNDIVASDARGYYHGVFHHGWF
jgi:hypothetical protein